MIPIINEEVLQFGWMTPKEVLDIVAIAEMTPGSLGINSATFVGLRTAGIPGALSATLGTMMPSLTICMVAAHFIHKFRDSKTMDNVLHGIRPICIGMLISIAFSMAKSVLWASHTIYWNLLLISLISSYCLFKKNLSIPKTILIAAVLGIFIG